MQFQNQMQYQQTNSGVNQFNFIPVSKTFSNIGTSVTYSLNPTTSINALNSEQNLSGTVNMGQIPVQQQQLAFNQPLQAVNYPTINTSAWNNCQPVISAAQFNQIPSGTVMLNNPYQNQNYYLRHTMIQPSVDISETTSDVIVTASVSNVGINNMNLSVTDNSVTISGSAWTGNENITLNRTVPLPTSIRAESVEANLQSGILEIRCPKIERGVRQRTTLEGENAQVK